MEWVSLWRTTPLNWFFLGLTVLGNALIGLGAVALSVFKRKRKVRIFLSYLVALAGGELITRLLKIFFSRPRPPKVIPDWEVVGPILKYGSFPSGHTLVAFLTACYLSRIYPRLGKGFYILAYGVGFSRIYLGVHFPTDVIGGGVMGYLVGRIAWEVAERRKIGEEGSY